MRPFLILFAVLASIGLSATSVMAEGRTAHSAQTPLSLPAILSDNAVLQAGAPIQIWGKGPVGAAITVSFAGHAVEAIVDHQGAFAVVLPSMKPDLAAQTLTIRASDGQSLEIENVVVGEVWLAGGQSNMEWELENTVGGQAPAQFANDPGFRIFEVERRARLRDDDGDIRGKWVVVKPRSARKFSAVGFYFGEALRGVLHQPVGVIQSAYGGTQIEAWTPLARITDDPAYADSLAILTGAQQRAIELRREWIGEIGPWLKANASASDAQLLALNPPHDWPAEQFSKNTPSVLFNGMIRPLLPYSMRGVIWYQGESNWRNADAYEYRLKALIDDWRSAFGANLDFGIVQIAPYRRYAGFPAIWDAQRRVAESLDGAGLVVITDLADLDDIHPRRKREVGERLAKWAARDVYQLSTAYYVGPLYRGVRFSDGTAEIEFDFAEGISARSGDGLGQFEVADADGAFKQAIAAIDPDNERVVLRFEGSACQVRYEWRPDADPRLTNSSGLPASPFQDNQCED